MSAETPNYEPEGNGGKEVTYEGITPEETKKTLESMLAQLEEQDAKTEAMNELFGALAEARVEPRLNPLTQEYEPDPKEDIDALLDEAYSNPATVTQ